MKSNQVYYYSDEVNDEFSGVTRKTLTIDQSYRYIHNNPVWKGISFVIYRIIMTPIAYLYLKIKFHLKVVNQNVLKQRSKENHKGFFLYGNHTQIPGDGFLPSVLTFPVRDYVIVNADNISLKGTRTFMEMIGACVKPNHASAMKNFMKAIKCHVNRGRCIAIYPEAHIWPYYTDVRPFKSDSFAFPGMFQTDAYCFTVTYQKRKLGKQPAMTVYVDGPFSPDPKLNHKEAQQQLRDQIYQTMKQRAQNSDYEYVKYIKREI